MEAISLPVVNLSHLVLPEAVYNIFYGQTNELQHCLDKNICRLLGFELFSIAEESKQIVSNGAKPAKGNTLREKEEEVSDELGEEDGLEDAESGEGEIIVSSRAVFMGYVKVSKKVM